MGVTDVAGPLAAAARSAVAGGSPVLTWLLWGGLALFFCGLYVGVYVWMRRPRFGEVAPPLVGQPAGPPPIGQPMTGPPATDGAGAATGRGRSCPPGPAGS